MALDSRSKMNGHAINKHSSPTSSGSSGPHRGQLVLAVALFMCVLVFLYYSANSTQALLNHLRPLPSSPEIVSYIHQQTGFLVRTRSCSIPDMNPLDATVKEFVFKPKPIKCGKEAQLFTSSERQLIFNRFALQDYGISEGEDYSCCYQELIRIQENPEKYDRSPDNKFKYGKNCTVITEDATIINEEMIRITCSNKNNKEFHKSFHIFLPPKNHVEERVRSASVEKGLSILVVGIDAVSRLNMIRQMPDSLHFLLNQMDAIDLQGYNKVGDNTFPNLVPVLSGLSEEELKKVCWPSTSTKFDGCPFIWKHLSNRGYRTMFGEDACWMGIFHYGKVGFVIQPTDYYIRPVLKAMADEIGHNKDFNSKLCYGDRLAFQIMLDYSEKAARTFQNETYFSFVWTASLSHDYLNYPKLADPILLPFLERLKAHSVLDNTVLILMSDHGIRWGGIRKTFQGKMEERLPFVYFVFPQEFKQKYSSAYNNLRRNSRLLTSPFDLHETLMDLSDLSRLTKEAIKERSLELSRNVPRGISLFLPVPETRTCLQAGIEDHWCTCHVTKAMPQEDPRVDQTSEFLLNSLNSMLQSYPQCAQLKLDKILDVRKHAPTNDKLEKDKKASTEIVLTVSVEPSGAAFEATVRHRPGNPPNMKLTGAVSRINVYGNQSRCVDDYNMKKYCYCES